MKNFEQMTTKEIKNRIHELCTILDGGISEEWDKAYDEYTTLNFILDERYREENLDAFNAFYKEHIEGKTWEEIDPEDWDYYSDWHKDMYGFRPNSI